MTDEQVMLWAAGVLLGLLAGAGILAVLLSYLLPTPFPDPPPPPLWRPSADDKE